MKHITYVPMICADGTALPEYIIISYCIKYFGADNIRHHDMDYVSSVQFPKINAYHSASGWINNSLFSKVMINNNIPYINAKRHAFQELRNQRAVIFSDGHGSRFNVELLKLLTRNNIDLVIFPPKESHLMQPLDVDIFGPFKNKFLQRLSFILSTKNNGLN